MRVGEGVRVGGRSEGVRVGRERRRCEGCGRSGGEMKV